MVATIPMATASMLQSCKDEEEHETDNNVEQTGMVQNDERCFSIEVSYLDETYAYGQIVQMPEDNILTDDRGDFPAAVGMGVRFIRGDIPYEISVDDIVVIKFTKYKRGYRIIQALNTAPIS